ncbi:MAG: peptide deformylase [Clostridiales bacterium]|nr:peptide deformylase [Clostridiales bacterium]
MALRNIRTMGDPCLTKICREVTSLTDRDRILIEDMLDTMYDASGVGLAAPQVGILKRIVVVDVSMDGDQPLVLINPEILSKDGEQTGYEGCLSVPGKSGLVTRPDHVVVKAYNENMQEIRVEGTELLARALCHEIEHLDGHLYVERVEGGLITNEELERIMNEES